MEISKNKQYVILGGYWNDYLNNKKPALEVFRLSDGLEFQAELNFGQESCSEIGDILMIDGGRFGQTQRMIIGTDGPLLVVELEMGMRKLNIINRIEVKGQGKYQYLISINFQALLRVLYKNHSLVGSF